MRGWRELVIRLRDALIAYIPPEAPALPSVTVREEPPQPQPIPAEWSRKDNSVVIEGIATMMAGALPRLAEARRLALQSCLDAPLTITSGREGKPGDGLHSQSSLHYAGRAVDARIIDFALAFLADAKRILGEDFDVILEDVASHRCLKCGHVDTLGPHLHAEYDP